MSLRWQLVKITWAFEANRGRKSLRTSKSDARCRAGTGALGVLRLPAREVEFRIQHIADSFSSPIGASAYEVCIHDACLILYPTQSVLAMALMAHGSHRSFKVPTGPFVMRFGMGVLLCV